MTSRKQVTPLITTIAGSEPRSGAAAAAVLTSAEGEGFSQAAAPAAGGRRSAMSESLQLAASVSLYGAAGSCGHLHSFF